MRKSDAEPAVRSLCHEWARETDQQTEAPAFHPSISAFRRWLEDRGYGDYLNFRSTTGARYDVEMWFDDEFKQNRRR